MIIKKEVFDTEVLKGVALEIIFLGGTSKNGVVAWATELTLGVVYSDAHGLPMSYSISITEVRDGRIKLRILK